MKRLVLVVHASLVIAGCGTIPERAIQRNHEIESRLNSKITQFSAEVSDRLKNGSEQDVIEDATHVVKNGLIDPFSAKFRDVKVINFKGGKVVCGKVNSKNSLGGYVGYQNFIAGTKHFILNFNEMPCSNN